MATSPGLQRLSPELRRQVIMQKRTPQKGWTRKTLADWGVPWPPPRGWKRTLIETGEWTGEAVDRK